MATFYSPKIVTDGLVLALDAANIKSFRGEPTTNLLYDNGIINWTIANLLASVTRSTVVENSVYRITSTTGGSFRFFIPLSKLTNGLSYNLSYKYRFISGASPTFRMNDWNDTSLFNVVNQAFSDYFYSSAYGTRATYDSTFRFMDFDISANTVVEIWDVQLEQRTYATPFVAGTRGTTVATGGGWADLAGNANHGELVNGPTYNSSNGGSLVFDGVDDFVTLGDVSELNFPDGIFSVSAWVTIPSSWTAGSEFPNLVSKGASAGWDTAGWSMYIFRNRGTGTGYAIGIGTRTGSTPQIGPEATNLPTNIPIHATIALGGNGMQRRVYINGVNIASALHTINPESNSTSVLIGRGPGSQYFPGQVYTTHVYNRELTAQEVLQNFNATRSRFGV
jgi:hypothetical protein